MADRLLQITRPSLINVKKACIRAQHAYMTAERTPDKTDVLITDVETDAQVVISNDLVDSTTCLAFRGTTTGTDWSINSRLWLVPSLLIPKGKIHAGFLVAWESIKKEVYSAIEKNGSSNLCVCGHSLGAGLAHIACTDIANKFPDLDLEVITFAGPRSSNKYYSTACRQKIPKMIRVVYDNDVVPNLPSKLLGYDHGDCECLHLKEDGTFSFRNSDIDWFHEFIRRFMRLLSFDLGVKDHDINEYIVGLEKITQEEYDFRECSRRDLP